MTERLLYASAPAGIPAAVQAACHTMGWTSSQLLKPLRPLQPGCPSRVFVRLQLASETELWIINADHVACSTLIASVFTLIPIHIINGIAPVTIMRIPMLVETVPQGAAVPNHTFSACLFGLQAEAAHERYQQVVPVS